MNTFTVEKVLIQCLYILSLSSMILGMRQECPTRIMSSDGELIEFDDEIIFHKRFANLTINDIDPYGIAGNDFLAEMNSSNIERNLRYLTSVPHMGGTTADFEQAEYLRKLWLEQGLDHASLQPYNVLLSLPGTNEGPSHIQILDDNGAVKFTSAMYEQPVTPHHTYDEATVPPAFLAYSASGTIISEELIYVNYGKWEDFVYLTRELGISVHDKLVMIRYGKVFRGNKLKWAEQFGAKGAIVYSDPADYHPELGNEDPYPNSWWLPDSGIQRGTIEWVDGDQSTPMYPAIESAYRVKTEDADIPKIICHPVGYNDARKILVMIGGQNVPEDWKGGLNLTYKVGPALRKPGWKIKLEVNNKKEVLPTYNTMGYIYGREEPDRYVTIGNHRDAWVFGSIDPSSATAVMMEMARAFGAMVKKGWRPRRTIVISSWGAGEHGYLGSLEWVEEYNKVLYDRAICHINVDLAVIGAYNLLASGSPLMHYMMLESSRHILPPEPELGFTNLHEHWKKRRRYSGERLIDYSLASTSDHVVFYQRLGIPSGYFLFMPNPMEWKGADYPLYHSTYETFEAMKDHLDPNFRYHKAVGDFWGLMTLGLAQHDLLPEIMHVSQVAAALREGYIVLKDSLGHIMDKNSISTHYLLNHIDTFEETAKNFQQRCACVDRSDPLTVRILNDQMLLVEKAFVTEDGIPRRPWQKNVIFGTDIRNEYAGWIFPGVHEALFDFEHSEDKKERIEEAKQQIAACCYAINSATIALRDVRLK